VQAVLVAVVLLLEDCGPVTAVTAAVNWMHCCAHAALATITSSCVVAPLVASLKALQISYSSICYMKGPQIDLQCVCV
jgi:hypothetical protein